MVEKINRRNTRQRRIILEELRKLKSHPTAVDLYEIARRRLPRISLGTVYRNLELLEEMGEIRKLDYHSSQARYDGSEPDHLHVQCMQCGRVDDVLGVKIKSPLESTTELAGYQILGLRAAFLGICPNCKRARGRKS
jgi:Fur family transcriptional regulator, ferric uptake regulator